MLSGLGITEIAVIVGVVVLLFGAKRIPDLAKSFGKAISEFRKARKEISDEVKL